MNWESLFSEHVLERGFEYFDRGLVADYKEDDNGLIEATVHGNEDYNVIISSVNRRIFDINCNCPYAETDNYCKHMAAVLFFADEKQKKERLAKKKSAKKVTQNTKNNIKKLIDEVDEEVIRNFLSAILEQDEKLFRLFKRLLHCEIDEEEIKQYKKQINNLFKKYAGRDDFIDYYSARSFVAELEKFLEEDIQQLLDNEQYKEALELTNHLFIKLGNQVMDDSDGGLRILAEICMRIWDDVLFHCEIKLKRTMFKWCIYHLGGSVYDYMEEYIEQLLFENFLEIEFLEEKLILTEKKVFELKQEPNSWIRDYHAGNWAMYHIILMKNLKFSEPKIAEYCQENLEFEVVRKYTIGECIKRKDYELAIQLLKEGKEKSKEFAGLLIDYSMGLKKLYQETGNKQEYENELWLLMMQYKVGDVDIYKELKSLYSDIEWQEKRERIFKDSPPYTNVDKLYKEDKLYDRLLKSVIEFPGLDKLFEHEKCLKNIYPKALLEKYENTLREVAVNSASRSRYKEWVRILKRMKKYPDGTEIVNKIVIDWEEMYKKRSAMMDELSKL